MDAKTHKRPVTRQVTKGIIYCATNRANGKKYVGQTTKDLGTRKNQHKNRTNNGKSKFNNAILKYGFDAFDWEVLEEADISRLSDLEKEYIAQYDSYKSGYNTTTGGCDLYEMSAESRKKMSAAKQGCVPWMKGKKHSEETKKKISAAGKGRTPWNKGKKSTQEPEMDAKTHKRPVTRLKAVLDMLQNYPDIDTFEGDIDGLKVRISFRHQEESQEYKQEKTEEIDYRFMSAG